MRYAFLLAVILPVLSAQDETAIYKERCAKCHDMLAVRVPSMATIKAMSGDAIYAALANGLMKAHGVPWMWPAQRWSTAWSLLTPAMGSGVGCPGTCFWHFPWAESSYEIERGRTSMLSLPQSPNSSRRKL